MTEHATLYCFCSGVERVYLVISIVVLLCSTRITSTICFAYLHVAAPACLDFLLLGLVGGEMADDITYGAALLISFQLCPRYDQ